MVQMHISIRLYGTLGQYVAGYDHQKGISLTVKSGTRVEDLIDQLGIPAQGVGIVSVNGTLSKADDLLKGDSQVKIFQPLAGG